jgi:hypothetical protein
MAQFCSFSHTAKNPTITVTSCHSPKTFPSGALPRSIPRRSNTPPWPRTWRAGTPPC